MESDCEDKSPDSKMSKDMIDFTQILQTLSHQISNQNASIQEHIARNDSNFQRVVQDNEDFKRDVRAELDDLRSLLAHQGSGTSASMQSRSSGISNESATSSSSPSVHATVSTSSSASPNAMLQGVTAPVNDVQNQMLLMLTESFTKLSSVLSDKKEDTKSDWPKFSGDHKKFRPWYLAIMAQLSLPPWQDLYDSSTNTVVTATTNSSLNGKLYAKLLISLEGTALQNVVSRTHLRANGVLLLQDLVQTYKPRHVPEVIAAKTSQFWGSTKRSPSETVDDYYNRFQELLDDLKDADEAISTKSAMRHFVFTLGSEFEPIQHNFRIGCLPPSWHTQDWPSLLVLCRDYFNSVKPFGISKSTSPSDQNTDRMAQRKKVREWFMNPGKYAKEIEKEQCLHPNKRIFHLTKSHLTSSCDVKKECDKLLQTKKATNSNVSSSSTAVAGQLHHITEEEDDPQDNVFDDSADVSNEDDNDTNDDVLNYFSIVSKHYLRLIKSTPDLITRHSMWFPIIADSGTNFHMFRDREFFESIHPFSGKVILGDGRTTLNIQGIGKINLKIGDHVHSTDNVRFIPYLAESIYSLFLHIRSPNHGLNSSFEDGLHIIFPTFSTKAILGADDVYLDATPVTYVPEPSSLPTTVGDPHCNHITQPSVQSSLAAKKRIIYFVISVNITVK